MKLKQLFENTNPQFPTSKEEVEAILKKYRIKNYTINNNLIVDVDGDVNLSSYWLSFIPIKFGVVSGNFVCSQNNLTTLLGAPREVGGDFVCPYCKLTSLRGAPREVSGGFSCSSNKLASLQYSPREVGGNFWCTNNPELKTLDCIGKVHGQIRSDIS
jgi:hypothetical protein